VIWVPVLVGLAMFIAGLWMLLRATDVVSDFEHDCMCVKDHEERLANLETTARQLQHSGEVPALEDAGWHPAHMTKEMISD
jgi:hypothetical protein